jgi:hypothetical protein
MVELAVSSISETQVNELAILAANELALTHGGKRHVTEDSDSAIYFVDQGMIVSLLIWRGCPEQRSVWIGIAWTMPNYRRRVRSLRRHAHAQGFVTIRCGIAVTNHRSRRLHTALGMQPVFYELPLA